MKVFVTGGTGVVGRPALAAMVAAGHDVRAVVRSPEKAELVRSLGASPVEVDLFDAGPLRTAVEGADAVCHLATNIPPMHRAARKSAWAMTDRLRTETTRLLVDACLDAGVGRLVKESLGFVYADGGDQRIDEDWPVVESPIQASVFDSERQVARFTESGGTGVVLRFGMFYGPDATSTEEALRLSRLRVAWPVMGDPDQYHPSVHADDAASAVVAALAAPAGTYNAAGEPSTKRAFADAFAEAFGRKRPRIARPGLVRAVSRGMADFALRSQRVSSQRLADATGWLPAYARVEDGWAAVAAARQASGG
jgi:nucleoside-diphosphate-sugar epimerase